MFWGIIFFLTKICIISKSEAMLHAVGENALQTLFHMVFACIEIPRILLIKGKLHWRAKNRIISAAAQVQEPLSG